MENNTERNNEQITEQDEMIQRIKDSYDELRRLVREAAQKEIEEAERQAVEATRQINLIERRALNKTPKAGIIYL